MRIFVTGATGFIGGAIVQKLAPRHTLFAMSRSQEGDDTIRQLGAEPVRCDLTTLSTVRVLRDQAIETQKYQGLVGLDADKPASPEVSEVYISTDTEKVYACIVAGQWSLLGGAKSHADVQLNGETDDHSHYFTETRLQAWHDSVGGEHVADGDNHDHRYGDGAGRVKTATAATLPNKGVGYVRLATDTVNCLWAQGPARGLRSQVRRVVRS